MSWRLLAHHGFQRDLLALDESAQERILEALRRLADCLESSRPEKREVALSAELSAVPDLRPLRGTGIPGSYRLRVGDLRIALTLLPAEHALLLTVVARRSTGTYTRLPALHARRVRDR